MLRKIITVVVSACLMLITVGASTPAQAVGSCTAADSPMELTYDLTKPGVSGSRVGLPLGFISGSAIVNWGDGTTDTYTVAGHTEHTYASTGPWTIYICGGLQVYGYVYNATYFPTSTYTNIAGLTDVVSFGSLALVGLPFAFAGAVNLTSVPNTLPSTVTTLDSTFYGAIRFNDPDITSWDTSHVTTLYQTFLGAQAFNQPIGVWDTSRVTSLARTFEGTTFNQSLNNWNVSNVTTMLKTFLSDYRFDQNLGSWDVRNVTNFNQTFSDASAFNNAGDPSIGNWAPRSATNMQSMFNGTARFNQNLGAWFSTNLASPTSRSLVTEFGGMFRNSAFNNAGSDSIKDWRINNTTSVGMGRMFTGSKFNQPIGSWDMSKVTTVFEMFAHNSSYYLADFNQDLSAWDLRSLTSGQYNGLDGFANAFAGVNPGNNRYSSTNYDKLLISLAAQKARLATGLLLGANKSYYTCEAADERADLIASKSMVITDSGQIATAPTISSVDAGNGKLTVTVSFQSCESSYTDIKYSIDNGATWISSGGTATTFTINSLTNGTNYSVLVAGSNAQGTGLASASQSGTPNGPIGGNSAGGSGSTGSSGSNKAASSGTKRSVYFDVNSAALSSSAKKVLAKVAKSYKSGVTINISGYVQDAGSSTNNKSLSAARAKAIAKFLKSKGVTATITTSGKGTPSSKAKAAKARRATLTITPVAS